MPDRQSVPPTVVYVIENHPLAFPGRSGSFDWLEPGRHMPDPLAAWLGPYQPEAVTWIRDPHPAGQGWQRLLEGIQDGRIARIVTHLALLSNVQQQTLIALCAQAGVQLVTPADAGRNMAEGDRRAGP
jgi:hypothetical protein